MHHCVTLDLPRDTYCLHVVVKQRQQLQRW